MSTMQCRHLLIKFSGSRNPVSRRTNESTKGVAAEAECKELVSLRQDVASCRHAQLSRHSIVRNGDCCLSRPGGSKRRVVRTLSM